MRSIRHRPKLNSQQAASAELADKAIDSLRDEWKNRCAGTDAQIALEHVKRLNALAVSHEIGIKLANIESTLVRYQVLSLPERKETLLSVADSLKLLRPLLKHASRPGLETGKLNSAIAPGRQPAPGPQPASRPPRIVPLDSPVTVLPRVGEAVAKKLSNLGVKQLRDLLYLSPRRHVDYSRTVKIGGVLGLRPQEEITVTGMVTDLRVIPGPPTRVQVRVADDTGSVRITWFNSYIAKQMQIGDEIAVSGKLDFGYGSLSFTSPEWEKIGGQALSTGRLTPIYPLTHGLAQKTMRGLTRAALDLTKPGIEDFLPQSILRNQRLQPLSMALEALHYPPNRDALRHAQDRLSFDNLLLLQIGLIAKKHERQSIPGIQFATEQAAISRFMAGLPFGLTGDQQKVIDEIFRDLQQPKPMARLLQGDVGSGKTVVAAAAAFVANLNGYQTAVMAPTEILAEQHFHNFRGLFSGLDESERPTVSLLTGSSRVTERRAIATDLESGELDILVGTHAIIQEGVTFSRLGLAIVDEQHRFGVRQRGELPARSSGPQPHLLSMTATPIPRTLNIVLHGDLDVSVISELPPGRVPIETRRYLGVERSEAYSLVREEVKRGHQVFVICPLVEESEASEAKAAVSEAQRLKQDVFPELEIAVLHGRMSGKEKDRIMTSFRDREADILVSTSVIEVGIDVPNATVMLVEGADRFGLAQLHQFRGRVGRGGSQSYCLLLADEATTDAEARLEMMVESTDGFLLAQKDLELRGPGDFIGTRQSGLPEMPWLDASFDTRNFDKARQTAESLLADDPGFLKPEHAALKKRLDLFWQNTGSELATSKA